MLTSNAEIRVPGPNLKHFFKWRKFSLYYCKFQNMSQIDICLLRKGKSLSLSRDKRLFEKGYIFSESFSWISTDNWKSSKKLLNERKYIRTFFDQA